MAEELRESECHNFENKKQHKRCMCILALDDAGLARTPFISVDKLFIVDNRKNNMNLRASAVMYSISVFILGLC